MLQQGERGAGAAASPDRCRHPSTLLGSLLLLLPSQLPPARRRIERSAGGGGPRPQVQNIIPLPRIALDPIPSGCTCHVLSCCRRHDPCCLATAHSLSRVSLVLYGARHLPHCRRCHAPPRALPLWRRSRGSTRADEQLLAPAAPHLLDPLHVPQHPEHLPIPTPRPNRVVVSPTPPRPPPSSLQPSRET